MINLSFHLKKLEREEENKPKLSRGKEIRLRAEINKIECRETLEKSPSKKHTLKISRKTNKIRKIANIRNDMQDNHGHTQRN